MNKIKSRKHIPTKNRIYKGRFGGKGKYPRSGSYVIPFPDELDVADEKKFNRFLASIKKSLANPEATVDFTKLSKVTINCGIILRAYADEFLLRNKKQITILPPKNKKSEAILRYLQVMPSDESYMKYDDLKCWVIIKADKLDTNQRNVDIVKRLREEIIPKCWESHPLGNTEAQNVASAVSEIYHNCAEHAYCDKKADSQFQCWYIGVGEYPDSNCFSFCVYDKGIGFKTSMRQNRSKWKNLLSSTKDSYYLNKAIKGYSGVEDGLENGRGNGIPFSISMIKKVEGSIEILSGKGKFSTRCAMQAENWNVYLEGALVSFLIPIEIRRKIDGRNKK